MAKNDISTPPSLRSSDYWTKNALEKKADLSWAEAKFKAIEDKFRDLEKDDDETKKIAIKAKDSAMKPHECTQRTTLTDLKNSTETLNTELNSWKRIRMLGLLSVVIAIITAAGFIFNLNASVNHNTEAVAEIKTSVEEVKTSQQNLKNDFERNQKEEIKKDKENMKELKKTIVGAIKEVANNSH